MDELIKQLTDKLGIDASVASNATNQAMAMVKQQAGDDLFSKITSAIPGASEAADAGSAAEASEDQGGGGLLGSISSMASGMLGGSAGGAMGLASVLGSSGLGADKIGGFATTIIAFLKDKLGDETVDQILEKVPMLKSLV